MHSDDIQLARTRLYRARKHIEEFHRHAQNFIGSGAYQVIAQQEMDGDQAMAVYRFKVVKPLDDEIGLIFGESIGQLRSPCDNLFNSLVTKKYPTPSTHRPIKTNDVKFPILFERNPVPGGGPDDFESFRQRFSWLPADLLNVLEGLQPFNPYITPRGPLVKSTHPLTVLNNLWNHDKHKAPLEFTAYNSRTAAELPHPFFAADVRLDGKTIDEYPVGSYDWHLLNYAIRTCHGSMQCAASGDSASSIGIGASATITSGGPAIEDGREVARHAVTPLQPVGSLQPKIAIDITLKKTASAAAGRVAYDLLVELHKFVADEVVAKLEPFFA